MSAAVPDVDEETWPRKAERILREDPILVLLGLSILVAFVAFAMARPAFADWENLRNIGQQTAVIGIVAVAMTVVILGQGLDLSPGATVALAGVIGALLLENGVPAPLAMVLMVLAGVGVGVVNGVLIAGLGISPFMATLVTLSSGSGAALVLAGGSGVDVTSSTVLWLGTGEIASIPASVLLAVLSVIGGWWLLNRTVYGRWVRAVGGNAETARLSLIPVRTVRALTYVLTGAAAGVGALITLGRLGSAQPLAGLGLEFSAITAVVIGGTKLSGGEGRLVGTVLGAVLVGVINSGLSFLQVPQETTYFVTAGLIVAAVLLHSSDLMGSARRLPRSMAEAARRLRRARTDSADAIRSGVLLDGVGKSFPGVVALSNVSFGIEPGEVVALMGENGAGKTTLVRILAGVQRPDTGGVAIDGRPVVIAHPHQAADRGISVIHQHLSLAPELTVAQNIFLGAELRIPGTGVIRRRKMRRISRDLIAELDVDVSPDAPVSSLSVGLRQMVEVAKALKIDARLVVMDEPTSALSQRERDQLFRTVRRLSERGISVLYITHRIEEVYALAKRAVVLRDGELIDDVRLDETNESQLISLMVGRAIENVFPYEETGRGDVVLAADRLADGRVLHSASIDVREGEIVALVGLMGSGRSELLRCLGGIQRPTDGAIEVRGEQVGTLTPALASRLGIGFVPEDRHAGGVVSQMSVGANLSLAWLRRACSRGLVRLRAERRLVESLIERLGVRPPDRRRRVALLSGGNQQKLVIGKTLSTEPRILLLDEPTRGVDVGAKAEIHARICELKADGVAVLMATSELPEALGVADRIVVLNEGRTVATLPRGATETEVMNYAFGRASGAPATAPQVPR